MFNIPPCYCYTMISKVQNFDIDQWSSDESWSSDHLQFSQKFKTLNSLWLSPKYRFKGASHHARNISDQSIYPALWIEKRNVPCPLTQTYSLYYDSKALIYSCCLTDIC